MLKEIQELMEEYSETYLTYNDGVWYLYIELNINHGISSIDFENSDLEKLIKEAKEYDPYKEV